MEVKVGIRDTNRELVFETSQNAEEITGHIQQAITNQTLIDFTDARGRKIIIPPTTFAYLEIGAPEARKIGFVS